MIETKGHDLRGAVEGPVSPAMLGETGAFFGGFLRDMSAGLQVARTLVYRVRFWIFGGGYLLVALWWGTRSAIGMPVVQVATSALMAALLGAFLALHLQRQFGTPAAKMLPHFAATHLAVGGALSLLIWVGVPAVQAWLLGLPAWGPIGMHALAGVFLALVACWRQAILLMAAVPVLLIVVNSLYWDNAPTTLANLILGRDPLASAAVIGLAVVAHGVAAVFLLRKSDQSVAISDDFAVEPGRREGAAGRWDEFLLRFRDGKAQRRLADVGFGWWTVQRWRIPSSISWAELMLATCIGVLLVAVGWWSTGKDGGALFGAGVAAVGMLVAPFAGWHMRRGAMSCEMLRPVTRPQYVRQIALALALDVCTWTALASIFLGATLFLINIRESGAYDSSVTVLVVLAFLWAIALFVYGVGIATFRSRYWLPLMLGIVLGWTLAAIIGAANLSLDHPPLRLSMASYLIWWVAGGAVLAAFTMWHWLHADMS